MPAPLPTALLQGMARHALTPAEQAPLWLKYRARPTPELRQRLALANLGLVAKLAKGGKDRTDRDAFQAGFEGLLKAIDKFEPERGNTFGTCARWWIRAYIGRGRFSPGPTVSGVGASRASKVTRSEDHLTRQLGRTPSESEVAAWLGLPEKRVAQGLKAARALRPPASLSRPVTAEPGGPTLADVLPAEGDPEQALAAAEETRQAILRVRDAVAQVPDRRQRHAYASYYLAEETLEAIGHRLGVSGERARQLALKAKRRVEAQLLARPEPLSPTRRHMLLRYWPAIVALEGPELVQSEAA
jgi:RNA polymerase sigma factor (sigma-70 family)